MSLLADYEEKHRKHPIDSHLDESKSFNQTKTETTSHHDYVPTHNWKNKEGYSSISSDYTPSSSKSSYSSSDNDSSSSSSSSYSSSSSSSSYDSGSSSSSSSYSDSGSSSSGGSFD